MTPAEAASLAGRYAKPYGAGAFAFPTRKELEADPRQLWSEGDYFSAVTKQLSRDSVRTHFTGEKFTLAGGSTVITHIARKLGTAIPLLTEDYVTAYLDDLELVQRLKQQGYNLLGATISASSEMKGIFHRGEPVEYGAHELATATRIGVAGIDHFDEMVAEVEGLTGFRDDWPLYSDGSWGALCLKGFYPEDPGRDMKPVEMNKKWQAEHPEDMGRTCEWTQLAADCPAIMEFVTSVPWWAYMERVRLLQMSGRNGKGGSLGRHTDIADKAMGTKDGQIVRFHLPLVTDPAIQLHVWELDGTKRSLHLAAGELYYLDARKPHAVTNPTGVDRVHLVVDVVSSPEVREWIAKSYQS